MLNDALRDPVSQLTKRSNSLLLFELLVTSSVRRRGTSDSTVTSDDGDARKRTRIDGESAPENEALRKPVELPYFRSA